MGAAWNRGHHLDELARELSLLRQRLADTELSTSSQESAVGHVAAAAGRARESSGGIAAIHIELARIKDLEEAVRWWVLGTAREAGLARAVDALTVALTEYAVELSSYALDTLLELPLEKRREVIACLRVELTGEPGGQTTLVTGSEITGWQAYFFGVTTCGFAVVYRAMNDAERSHWAQREDCSVPSDGYYLMDLFPIDPTGPIR